MAEENPIEQSVAQEPEPAEGTRRLIDGSGVKVNGEALAPKAYNVAPEVLAGAEVQVGKKKFVRFE